MSCTFRSTAGARGGYKTRSGTHVTDGKAEAGGKKFPAGLWRQGTLMGYNHCQLSSPENTKLAPTRVRKLAN